MVITSVYEFSEQTATFVLYTYSINSLVFITEAECVYSAVRTDALYNTDMFRLKGLNDTEYSST
jgi:hypothetical protein